MSNKRLSGSSCRGPKGGKARQACARGEDSSGGRKRGRAPLGAMQAETVAPQSKARAETGSDDRQMKEESRTNHKGMLWLR